MTAPSKAKSTERRAEIVRAAYAAIAEKGFEGLRMREIAERAGLNHATLHYYFAGKEALIAGVLNYIVEELSIGRDPNGPAASMSARQQLDAYFAQLLRQIRQNPAMFIVLMEINARSMRDPGIRAVVARNDLGWKRFLLGILRAGIQNREFRASLDPDLTADIIISFIRGLNVTCAGRPKDMARLLGQLSAWLASE